MKEEVSEKEKRITAALKKLTQAELETYRFFLKDNQIEIAEEKADELYELYYNGSSCKEIQKTVKAYSYAQIIAARVMYDWDERKLNQRKELETTVPEKSGDTLLETQSFIGDLLTATAKRFKHRLKNYIASGDEAFLNGVPLPQTPKDMAVLVDLFMKAGGMGETKITKTVNVNVNNQVQPQQALKEEDNEKTLDELLALEKDIQDADFEEVPIRQLAEVKNE